MLEFVTEVAFTNLPVTVGVMEMIVLLRMTTSVDCTAADHMSATMDSAADGMSATVNRAGAADWMSAVDSATTAVDSAATAVDCAATAMKSAATARANAGLNRNCTDRQGGEQSKR